MKHVSSDRQWKAAVSREAREHRTITLRIALVKDRKARQGDLRKDASQLCVHSPALRKQEEFSSS